MTTPQERNGEPDLDSQYCAVGYNGHVECERASLCAMIADLRTRLLQADQRAAEALEGERRANEKLEEAMKAAQKALNIVTESYDRSSMAEGYWPCIALIVAEIDEHLAKANSSVLPRKRRGR